MKHLQLMMVALFMLMGVSLTSCLNSESDPYSYNTAMVKVRVSAFYTYFETADGIIIEPTQESISKLLSDKIDISELANKVANIAYRWDPAVVDVPSDAETIKGVELYSIESLDAPAEVINIKGESKDSIADTPIIELAYNPGGYEYKPFFFDETTLILPIHYYMEKTVHTLRLLYYKEETQENGILKLYLRHNKNEDAASGTGLTSYEYAVGTGLLSLFYKAYDLRIIFSRYQEQTGMYEYPKKINIVYEANPYSWDLDDAQTETKTYTVEYKPQTAE
ncbi:hypothetical protein [uncultured Bacteroides sp.]|uniref:hypothetical protein n=1 Tax=uncultured Bacteroides sp. TaxID=162156 RepID=UPI00262A7A3E|nr:hypothetical protein [uncultured Bacteroides sp.]